MRFKTKLPTYLKPAREAAFWKAESSVGRAGEKRVE